MSGAAEDRGAGADTAGAGGAEAGSIGVTVNGLRRELRAGDTAHDLVVALGLAGRPLAVEVNGRVVPRARLADCMLEAESVIEIVTLVGGG